MLSGQAVSCATATVVSSCAMLQVPKKMTCNEFIRNNRGINGGDNLPQEFLTSLYDNISKNEIKISSEGGSPAEASPILWAELNLQSKAPRGKMLEISSHGESWLHAWYSQQIKLMQVDRLLCQALIRL